MNKSKYRIVEVNKEGYYHYYQVERHIFWNWWERATSCASLPGAEKYIKDQQVLETKKVVYTQ